MIVIDASAMIETLLRTDSGLKVEERIFANGETIHAPHLIDIEVAQVFRRYCMLGEIEPQRAEEAIADFEDFPVNRYRHDLFLSRIWQLRHNVTAYDAVYIALAESLPAVLITCDARLAGAPGHTARLELF
jgi:predicted nucleic acid-binding protein